MKLENTDQFEVDLEEVKEILARMDGVQTPAAEPDPAPQPEPEAVTVEKPQQEVAEPATEPSQPAEEENKKEPWQKSVLGYIHDLAYLLAALIMISMLLVRVVVVEGTSMNNTLLEGDYLLVLSNTFYREPQYGDVIVASKESFDNGAPIVKRVIATEGQWVDIDFNLGIVYVGDSLETLKPLDEPYTLTATTLREGVKFPLQVTENHIFVLGDNRGVSRDSRSPDIGLIHKQEVLGKVFFLFLPGTNGTDGQGNPKMPRDLTRIGVVN